MNLRVKITIAAILFSCLAVFFIFVLPSLIGFLLTSLLLIAGFEMYTQNQRHAYRTFNSALRAVCHRNGGVSRVATAFARSGPLRGPCYEYARRLLGGQEAVQAAADARVPLQLSTAVAMLLPENATNPKHADAGATGLHSGQAGYLVSAYSQIIYLTLTALVTCAVLLFVTQQIVPMFQLMFDEFGIHNEYQWLITGGSPTWILLAIMAVLLFCAIPLLTQSDRWTPRFLRHIPISPRLAESKAEILCGLADAVDAGMPIADSLELASRISLNWTDKASLKEAAQLIQRGTAPADALRQSGWVDGDESDWLRDAQPNRFAQLLRHFGHQQVRDAQANIRWLMTLLFPAFVILLGSAVLVYVYGFFGTLMNLVWSLA